MIGTDDKRKRTSSEDTAPIFSGMESNHASITSAKKEYTSMSTSVPITSAPVVLVGETHHD